MISINNINVFTNCESGKFHNWTSYKNTFKCNICGKILNELDDTKENTMQIIKNMNLTRLNELAKKYCITGELHNFIYDPEKKYNVCKKCGYNVTTKLSDDDLFKLEKNLNLKKNDAIK